MISIHEQINVIYGYLHSLWRFRWSALLISWLIGAAGWFFVYTLPDQYQARAAVNIDTSSIMQPLLQGLAVETNPEDEINVMTRILLSRDNLLSVIRQTDMDLETDTPEAREMLVNGLSKSIHINSIGGRRNRSSIYEISYESQSAEQAFKVVFNLLNTLIESTLSSSRMDTKMAEEFLNEQIRDYEQRLTQGEQRLAEFKKKNSGFLPDEQGGFYSRLRALQERIDTTRSDLRLAKQKYQALGQQLSGEKPVLSTSSYANSAALQLREYQQELNELLSSFTEAHPDVKAVRAKIADLRANAIAGADTTGFDSDKAELNPIYQDLKVEESRARVEVGTLQVKLSELRQKYADLKKSIDIIPQVEADLVRLNRDYDITRERYLALVERRESARLAQKVDQNNSELIFRVVDAPVVPLLPSGPNRTLLLAAVFLASIAVGFGWAVLRFLLHPTFVDFRQMQKMIDLPILGSISMQISPEKRRQRHVELMVYMAGFIVMCGSFFAAMHYQQEVSVQLRMLLASLGA